MKIKTLFTSASSSMMMIGAGLCAALLYLVLRQDTFQALVLAHISPLPIMISTLGLGPAAGFISAVIATLTVVAFTVFDGTAHPGLMVLPGILLPSVVIGAIFPIAQALPAWWLSFLASLSRTQGSERWRSPFGDRTIGPLEFYPIGRILVHAAVIVILLVTLGLGAIALRFGSVDAAFSYFTRQLQPAVASLIASQPQLNELDRHHLTEVVLKSLPVFSAAWLLIVFVVNLWLAGRILLISNRLPRPWPLIAHELRVPRLLVLAFAASLALCAINGWGGEIGAICAATLCVVYALQGIAVAHDLSGWTRWRGLLLFLIYAVVILLTPWSLVLFAAIALADTAFSFRDRKPVLASSKS